MRNDAADDDSESDSDDADMFVEVNNLGEELNKDYDNDVIADDVPSQSIKSKKNEKY